MIRRRCVLRGVVQGVGFRPHVARVAARHRITGLCGNDDASVFIEAQGERDEVAAFFRAVHAELPPLASVTSSVEGDLALVDGDQGFRIVESRRASGALTLVPPDIARCDDCLRELRDPSDRRYGYPFISCTDCGPRFSIIRGLPYDRALTTLADFPMCAACRAEYTDPLDRRFHAEPIGCFACGPRLWLQVEGREVAEWTDAVTEARAMLQRGLIVAVKGMGGFALFCDARNETAVARLRDRKRRPGKPLAVMAADIDTAAGFARLSAEQREELGSAQRPIVLVPRAEGYDLAASVAPGLDEVGIMLPSAPVHDLLLEPGAVYVATSGNRAGEPLCYRDADALRDLADIADAFLTHDRVIHVPVEDSVLMADGDGVLPVRRSRGFAPLPILLTGSTGESLRGDVLAVGGELKNTFTLTRDGMGFVSAHIGDMGALATQQAFERSVEQLVSAQRRTPELVVADLHPGYSTTAWATRRSDATGTALLQVQHHHAHALSLIAEHGMAERAVLCAVFDGTGYGLDGSVWGGEILRVRGLAAERIWHLPEFWLPGGDSAVRNPWKTAVALLAEFGIDDTGLPPVRAADAAELALVRSQLATSTAVVRTTSAGRLFDAVASILGIRHRITYEAQAAMELEAAARGCTHPEHAAATCDIVTAVARVARQARDGEPVACAARMFHAALAAVTARELLAHVGESRDGRGPGADAVGLSGGVFQNRMLVGDIRRILSEDGRDVPVLTHALVPANDGGLSLGQALAGVLRLRSEETARREEPTCV